MGLNQRRLVVIAIMLSVGLIFVLRLLYIQVIDDHWKRQAANITEHRITIYPSRGLIYDRHGEILVANTAVYDLMVLPKQVKELDTLAFCELIGISKDAFLTKMKKATSWPNASYKPSTFEKQIPLNEYGPIAENLHKYQGFYGRSRTLRTYPEHIAAHSLGFIGEVAPKKIEQDPYYRSGDLIGINGLELKYEEQLRGKRGVEYVLVDVFNNVKGPYKDGQYDTIAIPGTQINTSLDAELQAYGELLMRGKKGSIVAIEPRTGEVLCLVTSPSYDPEMLVGRIRNKNYSILSKDTLKPLFDRALMAKYPPGSIYKMVQAMIALEEGVINVNTGIACNKIIGCHNHPPASNVERAIQFSCNPYFYYTFKRIINQGVGKDKFEDSAIGLEKWRTHMHSFGLGQRLGIDLPYVKRGSVPSTAYYDKLYGERRWAFSTIYSISIGQGEVEVIPLQMANIAAIMANRGWYIDPHLVVSLGEEKEELAWEKHQTTVRQEYFELAAEAMRKVVEEPGGTARRARIDGITVCGKTGTAENPHGKDHSVFIAFAPKDEPKIAIATYVENAGFGGTWAAPISSLMMEFYLNRKVERQAVEELMINSDLISQE